MSTAYNDEMRATVERETEALVATFENIQSADEALLKTIVLLRAAASLIVVRADNEAHLRSMYNTAQKALQLRVQNQWAARKAMLQAHAKGETVQ